MIERSGSRSFFLRIEIGSTIPFKSRIGIGIGSKLLLNSIRAFFFLIPKLEVKVLKFMLIKYIFVFYGLNTNLSTKYAPSCRRRTDIARRLCYNLLSFSARCENFVSKTNRSFSQSKLGYCCKFSFIQTNTQQSRFNIN